MRTIKKIHQAAYSPIADLITYSPLPSRSVQQIDPFLFLNHHGPQNYNANNNGLPFGPHPHRGMETVTFILSGDIMHKDTGGHESVINAGGVQYMRAGKGLIHAEVSSQKFKKEGGQLEILQLWLNLPAKDKMTDPVYIGLQEEQIPELSLNEGKVKIKVVSGHWGDQKSIIQTPTNAHISTIFLKPSGSLTCTVPSDHNIFFYVIRGKITVNGQQVEMYQLAEFNNDGETLHIETETEAILLLGHAKPLKEPVVAQGPFVMNTEQQITEAYNDYREGKFGRWEQ